MEEIKILDESYIDELIQLSLDIFKPYDGDKNSHHQKEKWLEHFRDGGLILGAFVNNQLVGYNFGYRVNDDEYHYWMGGVKEEFRGKGLGRKLLEEQEKVVKDRSFKEITVNTYEHMWPVQYAFLQRHGFEVYEQEEQPWDDGKVYIKSFLRKIL